MSQGAFDGKRILIGISGGIAAYKSVFLIRELIKCGAEVKVVTTPSALHFVTELTLSVLSQNNVLTDTFEKSNAGTWHINAAVWADLIIIAPATVNTVAKIANGFADNALTTLVSARRGPIIICPAADEDMYNNPFHRKNISTLAENGFYVLPAEKGFLASTLEGDGRLPGIQKILDAAFLLLAGYKRDFSGKRVLVSAGPTFEDIDPVRFIGNRSSGKMGYAIAHAAWLRGAEVTLVSGPVSLTAYPEIAMHHVRNAQQMAQEIRELVHIHDAIIMAAAVADYKPVVSQPQKIKKTAPVKFPELIPTIDILDSIKDSQILKIGFALETESAEQNALEKLQRKNLDAIVLNSLIDNGAGFETDTNKITIIDKMGTAVEYPLMSKFLAANKILDTVLSLMHV